MHQTRKKAEGVPQNGGDSGFSANDLAFQPDMVDQALLKFPKEFKKSYFKSTDWRFIWILLASFVFHTIAIYVLFVHLPKALDEEYIIKIQNQYASRFLNETYKEEIKQQDYYQNLLRSASDWAQNLVEESLNVPNSPETLPLVTPKPDLPGAKKRSFEERASAREFAASSRRKSMAVLRDNVKNIGLLGIITGGSGLVSVQEVEDILAYADTASVRLNERLQHVSSLRIPRPGRDFFGKGLGEDGNIYLKDRALRAHRVQSSGIAANDVVSNLPRAREERVQRAGSFEKVSDQSSEYMAFRERPKQVFEHRDLQRIRKVVLSHNLAIQDCYRYELKQNPELKGKITVRFSIDYTGSVTDAEIVRSTMNLPRMENCILNRIRRWNDFAPVSPDQGTVSIRHTYVFGY